MGEDVRRRVRHRLVSGLFDLIVLGILLEKPLGAFGIIQAVYESFRVLFSPGTTYPRLKSLVEIGLIEESYDGKRKVFSLTAEGRETIKVISDEYQGLHSSLLILVGSERIVR